MENEPFWEQTYRDKSVSTFHKGPTADVARFYGSFKEQSVILDVGCGEGRNSIFLAGQGHAIDAFDLSEEGIKKAVSIANEKHVCVRFFPQDLGIFEFKQEYDVILSHGVLHLPEKDIRNRFTVEAQKHTKIGGYHLIGVFTNRLPATPDNEPFTKSLFDVGELLKKYDGWEILFHDEGTFQDTHPGDIHHEHAYENIIARKIK